MRQIICMLASEKHEVSRGENCSRSRCDIRAHLLCITDTPQWMTSEPPFSSSLEQVITEFHDDYGTVQMKGIP